MNQKAKVSSFMQERESMVEAIYTAPYAGKKFMGTSTVTPGATQSGGVDPLLTSSALPGVTAGPNGTRPVTNDRQSKLQEMFQEDLLDRLNHVVRPPN